MNKNGHAPQILRAPLIAPTPTQTVDDLFKNIVDQLRKMISANGGNVPVIDASTILGQALIIERLDRLIALMEHKPVPLPEFLQEQPR